MERSVLAPGSGWDSVRDERAPELVAPESADREPVVPDPAESGLDADLVWVPDPDRGAKTDRYFCLSFVYSNVAQNQLVRRGFRL